MYCVNCREGAIVSMTLIVGANLLDGSLSIHFRDTHAHFQLPFKNEKKNGNFTHLLCFSLISCFPFARFEKIGDKFFHYHRDYDSTIHTITYPGYFYC